ncbi:hypothetical protein [Borrelia hermsii]|uniref:Uncharacterized protein n=2 Tax=Borrelia hermsii TaxID=140 RepID=T1ECD1_BORHE|nr:hypothetical protein [Borrelia hermsii]ADN26369.1 hypothetical protein BHA113 [Borrelia hermsii]AMR75953.1 hypothetical protein A0V01_04900 [Borrelia hermsii]ANA43758.1 hypothetical protein AXX13_A0585 [Borrelia hermsii HS1]UCP01983.1 hypothetical protein K9R62_04930 [Borrelia hermsii]UPA08551.1 hypothetical protein bhDAH_001262 [Borrelia hermsii DAH]
MKVYKLFLKLLLAVSLFVFYDLFAKESEEFKVVYGSNQHGLGIITLNLTDDDGNVFAISYDSYFNDINVSLDLKSDCAMQLKKIDLDGKFLYFYMKSSVINGFLENGKWSSSVDQFDFRHCKPEWRELIKKAKGDLKFNVECIEEMGKLERKYAFKVSAANLSRLLDIFEVVYH